MKYIFKPIWFLLVTIHTIIDVLFFYLFSILSFLLTFKKSKMLNWVEWTEEDIYFNDKFQIVSGYDKNILETFTRRINFSEYKNQKNNN